MTKANAADVADQVSIRVDAAPETGGPYDIRIGAGLLDELPQLVAPLDRRRWFVISDDRVAELYGRPLTALFAACDVAADLLTFPAGEANKTRETWARLTDALLERGLGRDGAIIGLGGGVTADLAGFVAATALRGVPCVQVPTSLLAMIDAAIGGKTGVDTPAGKNLVGVIRQPALVVVDPRTLKTLDDAEYRAGLAEAIKHGAIADEAYARSFETEADAIERRDEAALRRLIRRSVEIKAEVVSADATERGPRAMLNFGHTIAHALERVSGYRIPHGFAVATGMVVEARIGERLGITRPGTADALAGLLRRFGLPTSLPAGTEADGLLAATRTDKKARAARVRYVLLERIGRVATAEGNWTFDVPDDVLRPVLLEERSLIS